MKYRSLKKWVESLTEEELEKDVAVFDINRQEVYSASSVIVGFTLESEDVLRPHHPVIQIGR